MTARISRSRTDVSSPRPPEPKTKATEAAKPEPEARPFAPRTASRRQGVLVAQAQPAAPKAPSFDAVRRGEASFVPGQQGSQISRLQKAFGVKEIDFFDSALTAAVIRFKQQQGLTSPPGKEAWIGQKTLEQIEKVSGSMGGASAGGLENIDRNNPLVKAMATGALSTGPDGTCVATTLNNMEALGVRNFPGGTADDPNNPRGAMVRLMREGQYASVNLPGSELRDIVSPAYGAVKAHVLSADAYEKLALAGKIPSGTVLFQTRHGFGWNQGSSGNDMGIVRDNGKVTFNYKQMSPIIYGDAKEVVLLVPQEALK